MTEDEECGDPINESDVGISLIPVSVNRFSREEVFIGIDSEHDVDILTGGTAHKGKLVATHPLCRCNFIFTGYRPRLTFLAAAKSCFRWHNDTVNIWTHLLAVPLFFYLMIDTLVYWMGDESDIYDHIVFAVFLIAAQVCFLLSAIYHCFGCMSYDIFEVLLRLDISGIILVMYGCFIVGLYYAFYCHFVLKATYMGIVTVLISMATYLNNSSRFVGHQYDNLRFAFCAGVVASGLVPTAHWLWVVPSEESYLLGRFVAGMFGFFGIGFWFWTTMFPESRYPGKFDKLFSSHQWWHVCIVLGMLTYYQGMRTIYTYRKAEDLINGSACGIETDFNEDDDVDF